MDVLQHNTNINNNTMRKGRTHGGLDGTRGRWRNLCVVAKALWLMVICAATFLSAIQNNFTVSTTTNLFDIKKEWSLAQQHRPRGVRKLESIEPGLSYTVCNGLSNQLLGHAAHISKAIASGKDILIPDAFIVNGVQNEMEEHS